MASGARGGDLRPRGVGRANVVERRAAIGTLRVLGFRKSMILKAFLIELSFVAVLGILLGLVLGIALTYNLFLALSFFGEGEFVIPWANLGLFLGLAFKFVWYALLSGWGRFHAEDRRSLTFASEAEFVLPHPDGRNLRACRAWHDTAPPSVVPIDS